MASHPLGCAQKAERRVEHPCDNYHLTNNSIKGKGVCVFCVENTCIPITQQHNRIDSHRVRIQGFAWGAQLQGIQVHPRLMGRLSKLGKNHHNRDQSRTTHPSGYNFRHVKDWRWHKHGKEGGDLRTKQQRTHTHTHISLCVAYVACCGWR